LFLDEIGEATPSLQVRLLRTLQEKEVTRVGGTKNFPVNVRMLMATNKDLQEEVMKRRFRKDLFYRINVIKIEIPPLRKRREDIPLLAEHFLNKFCSLMNKRKKILHPQSLQVLINHEWPGNVRELQNVIERVVVLHSGETIKNIAEHITIFKNEDDNDLSNYSFEEAKEKFNDEPLD
jgi:transcriptional regulator with GAF, ATPase, and Fis domain